MYEMQKDIPATQIFYIYLEKTSLNSFQITVSPAFNLDKPLVGKIFAKYQAQATEILRNKIMLDMPCYRN
jgi:hypothetical protein